MAETTGERVDSKRYYYTAHGTFCIVYNTFLDVKEHVWDRNLQIYCDMSAMSTDKKSLGEAQSPQPLVSARYAVPHLNYIRGRAQEHIVCLALNSRMCLIAKKTIFIGSLASSIIHPREIFKYAISKSAASIIIAHNHPSGSAVPSDADIEATYRLAAAGEIMGIDVLDHIIMGKNEHFSFADKGMLLPYKTKRKLNALVR